MIGVKVEKDFGKGPLTLQSKGILTWGAFLGEGSQRPKRARSARNWGPKLGNIAQRVFKLGRLGEETAQKERLT